MTRHCMLFAILGSVSLAQAGEPTRLTPALFPAHAPDAGRELAVGIADRAGAELYATGKYNHLHLKQVLSMARYHGLTAEKLAKKEHAEKAAVILGAQIGGDAARVR